MNYLKVPDSNIKLTDGSVVMLARFPGTKWVVHYGWYDYAGRRGMGWYFCSIPAQTVIPVTSQDLQLITLLDNSGNGGTPRPPAPPVPPPPPPGPPGPPPFPPPPGPGPHYPPGPGPFPPPGPHPDPEVPAFFGKRQEQLLDSAFVSLPSIKHRDALTKGPRPLPNGKLVKVNSVDGEVRYYSWNAVDERWDEKFFENDAEKLLEDYYNKSEIDTMFNAANEHIAQVDENIEKLNQKIEDSADAIREEMASELAVLNQGLHEAIETTRSELESSINDVSNQLGEFKVDVDERFEEAESSFNTAIEALRTEVAEADEAINARIDVLDEKLDQKIETVEQKLDATNQRIEATNQSIAELHQVVDSNTAKINDLEASTSSSLESVNTRISRLEEAVFNIQKIIAGSDNTVLVSSEGTVKDSGVSIGDDEIGEPSEYANDKVLATEKAVAKKVEDATLKWKTF